MNKKTNENGRGRLEDAIATLIQTQAIMAQTEHLAAERFARIEEQLRVIIGVLNEHTRRFDRLPDAIKEKIGFPAAPGA
jgi:hypothetical protein